MLDPRTVSRCSWPWPHSRSRGRLSRRREASPSSGQLRTASRVERLAGRVVHCARTLLFQQTARSDQTSLHRPTCEPAQIAASEGRARLSCRSPALRISTDDASNAEPGESESATALTRLVRATEIARSMRTKRRKQASKRSAVERPTPERVIEAVAAASSLPPWMLFSPRRSADLAKPRAAALYLLRQEAGLRAEDVARLTGRKRETVHRATHRVAVAVGHDEQLAGMIRRAQRLLASPHLNGQTYDPPPWSRSAGLLLGLEASRIAAGLTKRELARRHLKDSRGDRRG